MIKENLTNIKTEDFFRTVDLHVHTDNSDGKNTPLEMINAYMAKGFKKIAITDHNVISAYKNLKIPEGTQDGTMFKIKGKGIKKLRTKNDFGDLYVKVVVEVPKSLTKEQKELLQKLEDTFEQKQFPRKKEYKSKI